MSRNDQAPNTRPFLAGSLSGKILGIAREKLKLSDDHIMSVYESVPKQYHSFIRLLPQKDLIWNQEFKLESEHYELGIVSYKGKTYVEKLIPYVTVEGRIKQMIDLHQLHGSGYVLDTYSEQIGECHVMVCSFKGLNINAQPVETKERAIISFNGTGVNTTNPIENASTSAVGRALLHAGYGMIGSGLSSSENSYVNHQSSSKQKTLDHNAHVEGETKQNHCYNRQNSDDHDQSSADMEDIIANVNRLTRGMSESYVKNTVSRLFKVTFKGQFNTLTIEQLKIIESHFLKELEAS